MELSRRRVGTDDTSNSLSTHQPPLGLFVLLSQLSLRRFHDRSQRPHNLGLRLFKGRNIVTANQPPKQAVEIPYNRSQIRLLCTGCNQPLNLVNNRLKVILRRARSPTTPTTHDARNHLLNMIRRDVGGSNYIVGRLYGISTHPDQASLLVPMNHLIRHTVVTEVLPNWYGSRRTRSPTTPRRRGLWGRGPFDGRNHLLKNPRRGIGGPTYILGRLYGVFAYLDQAPLLVPLNHLIRYTVVAEVLPNWYGSGEDRHYLPTSQHTHWSIIERIPLPPDNPGCGAIYSLPQLDLIEPLVSEGRIRRNGLHRSPTAKTVTGASVSSEIVY